MSYKKITITEFGKNNQATIEMNSTLRKLQKEDFTKDKAIDFLKKNAPDYGKLSYTVSGGGRTYLFIGEEDDT